LREVRVEALPSFPAWLHDVFEAALRWRVTPIVVRVVWVVLGELLIAVGLDH
jgi:hypothetical protein